MEVKTMTALDYCKFVTDGTHDSPKAKDDGFKLITSKHLKRYEIDFESANFISEEDYKKVIERSLVEQWDILFSMIGTIGNLYIETNSNINYACKNMGIFKLGGDEMKSKWLYYYLQFPKALEYIEAASRGTTQGYVPLGALRKMPVDVVDDTIRDKIVTFLWNLDEKIKTNIAINENLEQQISSIYENLCENKSWDSCELGSLIEVRDGTHDSPKPQSDGYLLVTSKHLLPYGVDRVTPNRIAEKDFKKINERSLVEPGDVLMSMIGTIGLISFVADQNIDYAIKNVALFKTSKTPELAYYFLTFLKSKKTQQYIEMCLAGSTQKYISLGELRKMPIPDPDGETLKCFNEIVRPMYQAIILNTQENNAFAELRDSLLPKLISGELDISEIDI